MWAAELCASAWQCMCSRNGAIAPWLGGLLAVELSEVLSSNQFVKADHLSSIIMFCMIIHTKNDFGEVLLIQYDPGLWQCWIMFVELRTLFPYLSEHTHDVVQKEFVWVLAPCWASSRRSATSIRHYRRDSTPCCNVDRSPWRVSLVFYRLKTGLKTSDELHTLTMLFDPATPKYAC